MADGCGNVSKARRKPDPVTATDERIGGIAPAAELEAEHRAARTGHQPPAPRRIPPASDTRVVDGGDPLGSLKPFSECGCVLAPTLDPRRGCAQAAQSKPRVERREAGADEPREPVEPVCGRVV